MGDHCCKPLALDKHKESFKRVLYVALVINFLMFIVEVCASFMGESLSLRADSIDFLGDSANYAISLFVLTHSLKTRSVASIIKASSMLLFGLWVFGQAVYHVLVQSSSPVPETMGILGLMAFCANLFVAVMLYKFRGDDSNAQSVWLCTRNDVIGNIAVMLAATGVFFTGTMWPDLIVAGLMAILAIQSSILVIKIAKKEIVSL